MLNQPNTRVCEVRPVSKLNQLDTDVCEASFKMTELLNQLDTDVCEVSRRGQSAGARSSINPIVAWLVVICVTGVT